MVTAPRAVEHIETSTNPVVAVRALMPSLPPAERRVAEGIRAEPGDLVFLSSGDLAALASSWLGDGANESLSVESLTSILGSANIQQFAQSLGINAETASQGLADTIPELIDKCSSGGNLLDAVGGADGLMGMAKKLFS